MKRIGVLLLAVIFLAALPLDAEAKKKRRKKRRRKKTKMTIPVQIGVGPAIHTFTGPVADDQMWHYGLKTYLAAIIEKDVIKKNKKKIPKKYRKMALRMREIRIRPMVAALLPDTIFVSPKTENTGIFGAAFRLFGVGLAPISSNSFRISIEPGLLLTYAYIDAGEGDAQQITHFLRPGLDLKVAAELKLSPGFLFTVGWSSQVYIPQRPGDDIFEVNKEDSIWHVGQAFALLNFRIPYNYSM